MGVLCTRCGKDVASGDIKYLDAKTYVCTECFMAAKGKPRASASGGDAKDYDANPVSRVTMECGKCGFINRFRADSDAKRICSYCGSDQLHEKRGTAAQLLAESDENTEK